MRPDRIHRALAELRHRIFGILLLIAGGISAWAAAPVVELISPVHGAFAVDPAIISIEANALASIGSIQSVEFFADTNSLGTLSNAPYRLQWTNPVAGSYSLTAVATDSGNVSATSAVRVVTVLTNGAAIRVMPLGDSTTSGSGYLSSLEYPGAYRIRLKQLATNAGLAINFVGSLTNGPAELGDFNHEGRANYYIGPTVPNDEGSLATNVVTWLTNSKPDVVLLMIGSLDVLNNHNFTNAPARLEALVDTILSNAPDSHLILSSITSVDRTTDAVEAARRYARRRELNAAIPGIVSSRLAVGGRISFMDGAKATTRFDLVDDNNLTTNAYDRLGEFWFGALQPVITAGPAPTITLSSPTNGLTFLSPTNLNLSASAADWISGVQRVEFYQNDVKLGEATNAPFALVVSNFTSSAMQFSARVVATNGASAVTAPASIESSWEFIKAVNIYGESVLLEGQTWQSWNDATNSGGFAISTNATFLSQTYSSPLVPPTYDPNLDLMLRSLAYGPAGTNSPLAVSQNLTNGYYRFYVWLVEDFADFSRTLNIRAEGVTVATNVFNVPRYSWQKLGPFPAIVADGQLNVELAAACDLCGGPSIFGISIFKLPVTNTAPLLTTITNQTIFENTGTGPLVFAATDDFTAPDNLVYQAVASNPTLFPSNQVAFAGSGTNRTLTPVPATNSFGSSVITVIATDDLGLTNAFSFTVTVNDVDNAPTAANASYTLAEDTSVGFTLVGSDPDGSNVTFSVISPPQFGSWSGVAPNLTYTPNTNFNGADSLTFVTLDGTLTSALATVSFTITNVNDVPVATNQPVIATEDTPLLITLNGTDADNEALTFTIVSGPTNGSLSGFVATNGSVTYLAGSNFFGSDSFTYHVADATSTSAIATVSITVNAVNDTPTATGQFIIIGSLTNTAITLAGSDVETALSNLTFTITSGPTNGNLTGTAPNLTYQPDPGFVADAFQFVVSDGGLTSAVATVTIRTNQPGLVRLLNPLQGAYATAPANITLVADATDPDNAVTSVAFYEGTNLLGSTTNVPYSLIWSNVSAGSYAFSAVMQDVWGLSVTSAVVNVTVLSNGVPIRIMATGDSITDGSGYPNEYPGAYRVRLWQLLTNAGINVDFVGSFTNGPAELGDLNHQARSGAVIGPSTNFNNLYDSMTAWVLANPADIVILQAGANDVLSQDDLTNAPARLGGLIDLIQSNVPSAHVLAAQINTMVPLSLHDISADLRTRTFNAAVPAQIESRYQAGKRVSLVNNYSALTRYDLADGIHPSTNGYTKMGDDFFSRLHSLVTCKSPPVVHLTSPTNGTTFLPPANIELTAEATDPDGTVARVEFYRDAELIGTVTNAPWSLTLTNPGSGQFTFTARAVDNDGAAAEDSVQVRDEWEFVIGVNANGPAVPVEGYEWSSFAAAIQNGLALSPNVLVTSNQAGYTFQSPSFEMSPVGDSAIDLAGRTAIYGDLESGEFMSFRQPLANGTYHFYIWILESFLSNLRQTGLRIEGTVATTNIGTLPLGTWRKYGPYTATVADGQFDLDVINTKQFFGNPTFFGMAWFRNAGTIVPPVLSSITNQIGNPGASFGPLPFSVSDPNTAVEALTLFVESSNTNLIPLGNISLGGTGTNRTISITTASNLSGSALITISAHDQAYGRAQTTFTVNVSTNSPPTATPQSLTSGEDLALPITLTGSDPETNALSFELVSPPIHGELSGLAPNFTYQPASNFFGADSFTFRVNDGQFTSAVATVSITITNINDAPVATNQPLVVSEDVATSFALNSSDVDSLSVTFLIVTNPANGAITAFDGASGALTYLPNSNFFGTDSLAFVVTDGQATSGIAVVSLTITNLNDAPTATNQSFTVTEDVPLLLTFNAADIDSTNFTFAIVTGPTNGSLSGFDATNGTVLYSPNSNFFGDDSLTFTVSDGQATSGIAVVSLTITNLNDAPTATNQSLTVTEDVPLLLTFNAADIDSTNFTFAVVTGPTNGSLSGFDATNGTVLYSPSSNFFGDDSLTFTVSDGQATSGIAVVSLTITNLNDAPTATNQSFTVTEDVPLLLTFNAADIDSTNFTFAVVTGPTNGSLSGFDATNGTVLYSPNSNFFGTDSLMFTVSDGQLTSVVALVSLTITNANDAPTATNQSFTVTEDVPLLLTFNAADIDSTNFAFAIVTGPTNGSLSGFDATNGTVLYSPNSNFFGDDSLTFTVSDGQLTSAVTLVSLTITNVNDAPTATNQSFTVTEDVPLLLTFNAADIDSTNFTFAIVTGPTNGSLSGFDATNGTVLYSPNSNFFGDDSLTFTASDGQLTSTVALVSLTITNVSDAPVITNLVLSVIANTNNSLSLPAGDPDGDALTFAILTSASNGLVSDLVLTNGQFVYTPAHSFYGNDSLAISASDGTLTTTGLVQLAVQTPLDSDSDGIPDVWETARGLNPAIADAALDSDGDGQSNLEEYFANTAPLDSRSSLRLTTVALSGGGFLLTWDAVVGVRYRIQFSDGDANGRYSGAFTNLSRNVTTEMLPGSLGTATNATFLDDLTQTGVPTTPGVRYFKIGTVRH